MDIRQDLEGRLGLKTVDYAIGPLQGGAVPRGDRQRPRPHARGRSGRRPEGVCDQARRRRAAGVLHRPDLHRPPGPGHIRRRLARDRGQGLVEAGLQEVRSGQVRGAARARGRAPEREEREALRQERLRRRRRVVRGAVPLRRRVRDARLLRAQHVPEGARGRGRRGRQALDDAERALVPLRPRARRHALRARCDPRLQEPDGARRRPRGLLRREQEEHVHGDELHAARARAHVDALLGERRPAQRWRHPVRALGHRQDHPLGRPCPQADRRRRARLDAGRHLEPRGRLLREADRPRQAGRADHRRGDVDAGHPDRERAPAARQGARGHRPAGARPHRPHDHREHALLVPALLQPRRPPRARAARTPRRSCC